MWIAGKAIQIKRGKGYVRLRPGDPVPEAASWPNIKAAERMGEIVWVDDPLPTSPTNKELVFVEHVEEEKPKAEIATKRPKTRTRKTVKK